MLHHTMRPLVASSGRVKEAGVVRRFRARVSWSITASMSCSVNRNMTLCYYHRQRGILDTISSVMTKLRSKTPKVTNLINLRPCLELVAFVVAA